MPGPDDLVMCGPAVPHIPLLERLPAARAAGFAGISVMPTDIWALEAAGMAAREIARRIADEGLFVNEVDCIGYWMPSQAAAMPTHPYGALLETLTPERVIATAAAIGARSVVAVEMVTKDIATDEGAEAFARICDMAADEGLRAHIEFLPFGGIPDLERGWDIVSAADRSNGGLTIDSWHLNRSGSTLDQLAAIPGNRVHTVQINDAPATAQGDLLQETETGRLLPGEGDFDLVGFIRTLDRIGSTAPIGVEIFSAKNKDQPVDVLARQWAQTTRAVLGKARGLT